MGRRGWITVGVVVAILLVPLVHQVFWTAEAQGQVPFTDRFERDDVGEMYTWFYDAHPPRIEDGWLRVGPVQNNPVWLKVPLPDDVRITFDVRTTERTGDIKFEAFGNGRDHESGFVFILGGWNNTISALARQDEHGEDRRENRDLKVVPGRTYHMRVEREDGDVRWYVDGRLFLEWEDGGLTGRGHDRFGFSAWETPLYFDDLEIEAL